ncbi:hypothetical protein GUJ93_ZPchr0013g35596 [Zizania palustris]|uniref:Bifunctional inhibitor/plant lipid transfer protein/seed storage helical domain-containing protein n=1 Tax=Zizania palustris TaxID=103762 RepID=A0A8J5X0Q3_ZIZPA|nr:hypothetical protein GUJ93_ZPchr0013g35596 [Zizania palustris]
MTMTKKVAAVMLVVVMLAADGGGLEVWAACDVGQLAPCMGAITGGTPATAVCCSGLRAQQGCLCQFAKDPRYASYVNSPNARRTVVSCGISIPSCH